MTVQFAEGRAVGAIDTLSLEDETHSWTVFLFGCVDALYMRSNLAAGFKARSYRRSGARIEVADPRI
jgi:hypothetical protein